MKAKAYIEKVRKAIDKELERLLPAVNERPSDIHKAMGYALKGGKRIRPLLCLACAQASGGRIKQAVKAASAIEMLHTYSLIHDDLPPMDNDDYRRGRPSCHKKFGEACAVLAGDALLTLSFNILSAATPKPVINCNIVKEISKAAGTFGMIGGQAADISECEKDLLTMEYININKTGALIAASCKIGAMAAGAGEKDIKQLLRFGEYIGLAFQIVDDILDSEGFAKVMGPGRAYDYAKNLTEKSKKCISYLGPKARMLYELADFLIDRKR